MATGGRSNKRKRPQKIDVSHKPIFVDLQAALSNQCGFCLNTLENAVAVCQDHVFCEHCVDSLMQHTQSHLTNIVTCPTCRASVNVSNIKRVKFIDRQIANLTTKCPNSQITPQKAIYLSQLHQQRLSPSPPTSNHNNNHNKNKRRRKQIESESRSRSRSRSRDRLL